MKHKRDLQPRVNIDTKDEVLYCNISGTQCMEYLLPQTPQNAVAAAIEKLAGHVFLQTPWK